MAMMSLFAFMVVIFTIISAIMIFTTLYLAAKQKHKAACIVLAAYVVIALIVRFINAKLGFV